MNFVNFEANEKTYRLRLTTRNTVALEKVLGCNPLSIFDVSGKTLPPVTTLVAVLHASLQAYHRDIDINEAYTIFDEYLENNSIEDFIYIILEIYKVSGLIPKGAKTEKN